MLLTCNSLVTKVEATLTLSLRLNQMTTRRGVSRRHTKECLRLIFSLLAGGFQKRPDVHGGGGQPYPVVPLRLLLGCGHGRGSNQALRRVETGEDRRVYAACEKCL